MSQQNPQTPRETGKKGIFQHLRTAVVTLLESLYRNWPTKLLALVLAIALWAGLITQDPSLTRERRFANVSINVTGADTLKRNGFIVTSNLDEVLDDVTLTVDVPQKQYATVQASNYNVRVDLTRIKEAGTQEVRILSTSTSTYGSVTALSPATVQLEVDEYITRYRIPVAVEVQGDAPEGYYAGEPSLDPPTIAVSGPKKLVDKIVRAEVKIDQTALPSREGTVRKAVPFTLMDEDNNAIQSDLLQVTSESVLLDSIIVEQHLYASRSIPMTDLGLVTGTPAEGYEIKDVYITPAEVTIAGRRSVLEGIDLLYANSPISVNNLKSTITQSIRIRQPAQLAHISTSEVIVTVEIGPVMRTETFENIPLRIKNLADGLTAHVDVNTTSGTVHLTGEELWLDTVFARYVTLYCDATGLGAGTYELQLMCDVRLSEDEHYTYEIEPASVQVTIIGPTVETTPAILPAT